VTAYDGSGYVLDLDGANRTAYLKTLQGLIDNKWIDKQARGGRSKSVDPNSPLHHVAFERPPRRDTCLAMQRTHRLRLARC